MSDFLSDFESCGWLKHIKAIMDTSVFIAKVTKANIVQLFDTTCVTIYHFMLLYATNVTLRFTICHYMSLYDTICYYVLLYITVCHYMILYVTLYYVCHYMPLYITLCHFMSLYVNYMSLHYM